MKPVGLKLWQPEISEGRSVAMVMGSMRSILLGWGMATVCLYLVSYLLPMAWTGWLRVAYLSSGVTWSFFAYSMSKHSLRLCFPVVMILVMQLWSIVCMVHAWTVLARPPDLGRAEFWMLEVLIPFFMTSCLTYIEPKARDWVLKAVLIGFTISCICAALQFMRVPPFLQIAQGFYAQKDMDFWDGKPGLRAVGLTSHPALLATQALICFGIIASRIVSRKWKPWEMGLMFFFSGVVVVSQARMLYLVLAVLWTIVGIMMLRHDKLATLKIACVGVAILFAGIMAAPTRLGYGLMSTSFSADDSYNYRAEKRWSQADKIYRDHAIFGIGPDAVLFLGQGEYDRYNFGMALMESGYRAFLAMYGLPGLLLLFVGLFGTIGVALALIFGRGESEERRAMGFLGLTLGLIIMLNSYSANTFDQYLTVPVAFLLCGVIVRTRAEMAPRDKKMPHSGFVVVEQPEPAPPGEPMSKLRALL